MYQIYPIYIKQTIISHLKINKNCIKTHRTRIKTYKNVRKRINSIFRFQLQLGNRHCIYIMKLNGKQFVIGEIEDVRGLCISADRRCCSCSSAAAARPSNCSSNSTTLETFAVAGIARGAECAVAARPNNCCSNSATLATFAVAGIARGAECGVAT